MINCGVEYSTKPQFHITFSYQLICDIHIVVVSYFTGICRYLFSAIFVVDLLVFFLCICQQFSIFLLGVAFARSHGGSPHAYAIVAMGCGENR